MTKVRPQDNGLLLTGLDGSNPLGFLAAVGALRLLSLHCGELPVEMRWELHQGRWSPRVYGGLGTAETLVEGLESGMAASDPMPWQIHTKLPFEADIFRNALQESVAQASPSKRDGVDTLCALGVDILTDKEGNFQDTRLRMVRAGDSAGNGLLAYGRRIREETSPEDLESALFQVWRYQDKRCALRWDPAEYHGYALQWKDPSKQSAMSVRGANRLALAALPVLPTVPAGQGAVTVGFGSPDGERECLTWPIWSSAVSVQVVGSLVALPALQRPRPPAEELNGRGISAVFRCESLMTSTYYRNFSPAQRIA